MLISNLYRSVDISYKIVDFSSYLNFFTIRRQSDLRSIEHDLFISDQTPYTIRFTGHFTLRSLVDNFGYPSIYDFWQWSWFSFIEKCRRCLHNWRIIEKCRRCLHNWRIIEKCRRCLHNWGIIEKCRRCLENWGVVEKCRRCLHLISR